MSMVTQIFAGRGLTLSDEGLVYIQQDVAALDDHALDSQVLADILSLAHLVMHNLQEDTR